MNTEALRAMAEEVRCAMCFEIMRDPRSLSCSHSFCTECIEALAHNSTTNVIECPLCRRTTLLPENIASLPVDLPLQNITSLFLQDAIKRAISPDFTENNHDSNIYGTLGVDYSFIANQSPPIPFPRDLTQSYQITPTTITQSEAKTIFRSWLSGLWFSPSSILDHQDNNVFLLTLIPFYHLEFNILANYTFSTADHTSWTKHLITPEYIPYQTIQCASNNEEIYSLMQGVPEEEIPKLSSCDFCCSLLSIEEPDPWFVVWKKRKLDRAIASAARNIIKKKLEREESSTVVLKQLNTQFSGISYSLMYCPFYISSYEHQGNTYSFAINAGNGKIYGERPYGLGPINLSRFKSWLGF